MLRDVREDDLPIFFEHQRDPEACRMAAFPPREYDAFMVHWRTKVLANPAGRKRTIVVDDCVAGNIVSWDADGRRLVGYWIGREYWGRGIATEAGAAWRDHGLGALGLTRIVSMISPENAASRRIAEKLGFTVEREAMWGDEGPFLMYSIGDRAARGAR